MPTYEYSCECGHEFEVVKKMSDYRKPEICPTCGREASKKVSVGATFGDEAAWLNDPTVRGTLQDDSEIRRNPNWSRTDYKRTLKEKGIVER